MGRVVDRRVSVREVWKEFLCGMLMLTQQPPFTREVAVLVFWWVVWWVGRVSHGLPLREGEGALLLNA